MGRDVFLIIPLLCLRPVEVGFPRIWGELRGWQWSSSRPWPQCPVSRWLACCSLPLKKLLLCFIYIFYCFIYIINFTTSLWFILYSYIMR
ncbi:hypothetical protein HanIR_Chr03g0147041 [Helianthus annuus]|nr:hypothetical protein HanIR_Chr03g0147041 [Helianthus annuus]